MRCYLPQTLLLLVRVWLQSLMEELGITKSRRSRRQAREELEGLSGTLMGEEANVQWGGTGLSAPGGSDLEVQEKLLSRMFKPHKVRQDVIHIIHVVEVISRQCVFFQLLQLPSPVLGRPWTATTNQPTMHINQPQVKQLVAHQKEAYAASLELKRTGSTRGKFGDEARLHRQLRVVAGTAANKRLLSSQGAQTRPMMEQVSNGITIISCTGHQNTRLHK